MPLNSAQLTTLKAAIAANATVISLNGVPIAINAIPDAGDGNEAIAAWYNLVASPAYRAWNPSVSLQTIRSTVNITNYTPADTPPASGTTVQLTNDALLFQNRAMKCQLQQANALFLVQGTGNVDCSPLQFRQAFNDCMTGIPSGASGAAQNAGWGTAAAPGAVRLAMQRTVTNAEKLFAVASTAAPAAGNVGGDARGSTTNPDTLVVIGPIDANDVTSARES